MKRGDVCGPATRAGVAVLPLLVVQDGERGPGGGPALARGDGVERLESRFDGYAALGLDRSSSPFAADPHAELERHRDTVAGGPAQDEQDRRGVYPVRRPVAVAAAHGCDQPGTGQGGDDGPAMASAAALAVTICS
jgi:hypothetical protein